MRTLGAAIVIVASIGGCSSSGGWARDPMKSEAVAAMPACLGEQQCDAMWGAARRWVRDVCGYPIAKDTVNLIETYNTATNTVPRVVSSALACSVRRVPRPDGGYDIAATASCSAVGPTRDPCYPPVNEAIGELNRSLNKVVAHH